MVISCIVAVRVYRHEKGRGIWSSIAPFFSSPSIHALQDCNAPMLGTNHIHNRLIKIKHNDTINILNTFIGYISRIRFHVSRVADVCFAVETAMLVILHMFVHENCMWSDSQNLIKIYIYEYFYMYGLEAFHSPFAPNRLETWSLVEDGRNCTGGVNSSLWHQKNAVRIK